MCLQILNLKVIDEDEIKKILLNSSIQVFRIPSRMLCQFIDGDYVTFKNNFAYFSCICVVFFAFKKCCHWIPVLEKC